MDVERNLEQICLELFDCGALKFGNFKVKIGFNSPVYFDLRVMISNPPLMNKIADAVWHHAQSRQVKSTLVCGVPYTALPIATLVAVKSGMPMLIRRKEPKKYGTMKLIEGSFTKGDECLIIEDVVSSGKSVLETAADLRHDGLTVKDAIVMVDREQGGPLNLDIEGIRVHSIFTLSKILAILLKHNKIDQLAVDKVRTFIESNQLVNGDAIPRD